MKLKRKSRTQRGFTLPELLIAAVVIGVLASIALPAYTSSVNKSRGMAALADIKKTEQTLERYLTSNNTYPETLAEAGVSLIDQWGSPYQYLRMSDANPGKVRKNKSLHPLNTDYDLYSMGADGKSASPLTAKVSQDDIIRANNGSFIGYASDY